MPQLYRFRTEIDEWRFNDSKKSITFLGKQWNPAPIARKKWERSLDEGEINISLGMDVDPAKDFLVYNPSHPVWIDVYDQSSGNIILSGKIISADYDMAKGIVQFKTRLFSQMLDAKIPLRTFSPSCQFALFDNDCGVDEDEVTSPTVPGQGDFKVTLLTTDPDLVVSANGVEFTHPHFNTYGSGFFRLGSVRNGTEELFIISHVNNKIITLTPFIRRTNVTYEFLAGCDKLTGTCVGKFFPPGDPNPDGNINRYGGFPKVPRKNPVTEGY